VTLSDVTDQKVTRQLATSTSFMETINVLVHRKWFAQSR